METFVVRVFVPARKERLPLTGIVEHVGTGRALAFRGTAALIDVVLHELDQAADDDREEAEER